MKKLERRLTLTSVVAISIGGMLGSGLFVLPGLAAAKTGPSVWLAYLLAGLCVLPAALSKAELATAMPTSGGTYIYIERTFGPIIGTISGLGLWLSLLLKSSFALVGFGAYLLVLADVPLVPAALFFLILIVLINIMGVKKVGKVQVYVVSASIIGLAVLLVMGGIDFKPDNLQPFLTGDTGGLITATAFVFVSYAGVTKVAAIAEEVKNPDRNLPIAMMLALGIVTVLYAAGAFMLVVHVPVSELVNDIHPIFTLADTLGGKTLGIIVAVLGVVTLSSMANSGVLAASRFPFAMGRDRLVPPLFQRIHPRYLTPATAIIATGLLMALVIIFLDVEKIAKLASAFKVTMFIAVNACLIVLRETGVGWYQPRYRSPLYPWMQIFGIVTGLILLVYLGTFGLFGIVGMSMLGLLVYYGYGRKRTSRRGVLRVYGHRPAAYLLYGRERSATRRAALEGKVPFSQIQNRATDLDGSLIDNAGTAVTLFGKERSPEMLVEMGAALAGLDSKVQVVHLQEVPDQTTLDDLLIDEPIVISLNRRIRHMADVRKVDVDFDAAVTHDLVRTVQEISAQTHCRWLVAGWSGRAGGGILVRNPLGWLLTHLDSNFALFKDKGVRYINRILIALRPGREDANYLLAADSIATFYRAEITLLRVARPTDDLAAIRAASQPLLDACTAPATLLLETHPEPVDRVIELSAAYDLLIIGTPEKENWLSVLMGDTQNRIAERSPCSVLRLTVH